MKDQETDKACDGVMDSYFRENHLRKPSESKMMRRVKVQRSRSMKNLGLFKKKVRRAVWLEKNNGREEGCLRMFNGSVISMDCSLPGSSVYGIFPARILEWVTISYFRESSQPGIRPVSPALQVDSLLNHWATEHGAGVNSGWQARG